MNIRLRWLALVLGATLLAAALARADDALEEVMVTGQQPGPGLWQVTRPGDPHGHVLWILGNYSPLPKNMTWRSSELAAVLAASQAVLAPVSVSASAGPLGGITVLPSLMGVRKNPDHRPLQQVVPADLYARWLPLKARYLGNDDRVEAWRPIFAAQELYRVALKKHELVPYDGVWPAVEKLARKRAYRSRNPVLSSKWRRPGPRSRSSSRPRSPTSSASRARCSDSSPTWT